MVYDIWYCSLTSLSPSKSTAGMSLVETPLPETRGKGKVEREEEEKKVEGSAERRRRKEMRTGRELCRTKGEAECSI